MSIRPISLAELQKMYSAFTPPRKAPKPRVLWALADFYSYLSEYLVVIYADTDTPYQEILTQIESISLEEERHLFKAYFDRPAGKFRRELLYQPSLHPVPKEISRVHPVLRAVMLQIALGDQEIITFTQQFSDKFLNRAAARASMHRITERAESIGQIMQDKFRSNLKQVLEESSGSGCLLPRYWLGVEYAVPSRRDERGAACGFHLHGQIVANKATLPDIKRALYKVAECYDNPSGKRRAGGYRQRFDNLAVHFGLPSQKHYNGGGKTPCISIDPSYEWVSREHYDFGWAQYAAKDTAFTSYMAEERLGVRLGASVFYQSPGVNQEAQACLGIFRRLQAHLHAL